MRYLVISALFYFPSSTFGIQDTLMVQNFLDEQIDNKNVFGIQISFLQDEFLWNASAGNLKSDDYVFIASTTKLFVTAITLKYISIQKISFKDPIRKFLSDEIMTNLHVFKNQDYSDSITIEHLLAHTSGLPDYFSEKIIGGKSSLMEELFEGRDTSWRATDAIELSKKMRPHFKPGDFDKAYYSDTNFQLLRLILEMLSGQKMADLIEQEIIIPLGMRKTYMYVDPKDSRPELFYFKTQPLSIPKAMASFNADGGAVSNASDLLKFLLAFFEGEFYPKEKLIELYRWNKIMFPLNNGIGLMMAKFPGTPMFIGHSGHSGAFAFFVPEKNLYVAGTVNQVDNPETSFKMLAKLMRFF